MRDFDLLGWEWASWWALQGDESLELVRRSATELQTKTGDLSARLHASGDVEGANVAGAAHVFLIAMSEMLNPDGTSMFKAELKHRNKGKPINKHERAVRGHTAAGIVDRLVADGIKQEAAIAEATERTGLSRAEIMAWLSSDRNIRKMTPAEIAAKFMPPLK